MFKTSTGACILGGWERYCALQVVIRVKGNLERVDGGVEGDCQRCWLDGGGGGNDDAGRNLKSASNVPEKVSTAPRLL